MICLFSNVGKESQQWWRLRVFHSTNYKIKGLNGLLCTFKKTESEEIQFLLGETPCFLSDKIASMLWYRFVFLFYFILLFSTLCSTIALKWLLMFSLFACPLLFVCLFFFATPFPKLSKTNCELCRSSPSNFYCAGPRRPISSGRDWPVLPTRLANQNTGLAWYYPRVLPAIL